jgi:hypothetical protein
VGSLRSCTPVLFERPLFESHADPIVAAPDGMAAAHELIGFDKQGEGLRQEERIADVKPRAAGGDVPHRAIHAAATTEGKRAVLENPVPGRHSLLDHCREFQISLIFLIQVANRNYGYLNRMSAEFSFAFTFR